MEHQSSPTPAPDGDTLPLPGRLYELRIAQDLEAAVLHNLQQVKATSLIDTSPPVSSGAPLVGAGRKAEAETPEGAERHGERTMPFIGEVLNHVPGESITVERHLTIAEDLHLADHAFVHAPGVKPLSACLPVLPMTMSLEILAEVAACLAPGHGLIGFAEIEARRWIELADTDTLRLRISAQHERLDPEQRTHDIVASISIGEDNTPAISATVICGPHYLLGLSLAFSELTNPSRYPLTAEQVYAERRLFHGPSYQCLAGGMLLGDRGAVGELLVRSPHMLFRSNPRPLLLTDPALLDAVGQLIGVWAMERERYVFPIGIEKLELYRPTPSPGTRVPVRLEITHDGPKTLHADVEIQDGAGGVWMRIKGWRDWKFRWERRLLDFRRLPSRYLLSRALALPALERGAQCQMLAASDLGGFDAGLLARFYLHVDEMPAFRDKAGNPKRREQWLLGRIAAKDAVRSWIAKQSDASEMLHPAAFVIENNAAGQPVVQLRSTSATPPAVSISHCEDRAIAIVHGEAAGVDLERIIAPDNELLETITTERERKLLMRFAEAERPAWATRLWCAKETAGKLEGTGVDGSPRGFEASALDVHEALEILHLKSGRRTLVNTIQEGEFIVAYAVGRAP